MPVMWGTLLGVAALVTALGFIKPVWFVSVGYGYTIAALAATTAVLGWADLTVASVTHLVLLFAWGVRLSTFLVIRERQASYQQRPDAIESAGTRWGIRFVSWIGVALLYLAMFSPAVYVPSGDSEPTGTGAVVRWIGLAVLAVGLVIEVTADAQKQAAKRAEPSAFVRTGLFSWVRSPNYLGEILVWVGNLVAGAALLTDGWSLGIAVTGVLLLVLIMIGATRRLEWVQGRRYGDQEAFQSYIRTVPVLIPWVPIYSVEKTKIPMV
ncbi:MAG: DUF1295 domain-containing protein [Propioniciclava sp.]